MNVHSVYKLCKVSTNYTWGNVYVHSVYKARTVSTNYAQCPQTFCIRVYMYALLRAYMYISEKLSTTRVAGPLPPCKGPCARPRARTQRLLLGILMR